MNCRSESVIANWESVIVHRLSVPSRISLDRDERNFQNLPWLKLSIGWSVSFIHDKKRRKRDVLQRRFSNCFTLVIILSLALSCTLREEKPYTVFFYTSLSESKTEKFIITLIPLLKDRRQRKVIFNGISAVLVIQRIYCNWKKPVIEILEYSAILTQSSCKWYTHSFTTEVGYF